MHCFLCYAMMLLCIAVPSNISKYNYKDHMYKVDPPGPGDHLAMHLAIDGWALFREGDEAKLQAAAEERKKASADEAKKEAQKQARNLETYSGDTVPKTLRKSVRKYEDRLYSNIQSKRSFYMGKSGTQDTLLHVQVTSEVRTSQHIYLHIYPLHAQ